MQENVHRRLLSRRPHTFISFAVALSFLLVAQAALVLTAAKDGELQTSCFEDPSRPLCKNADVYCKFLTRG